MDPNTISDTVPGGCVVHGTPRCPCRSACGSKIDISCSWRNGYFCSIQQGTECLPGNFHSPLVSNIPVQNFVGDILTQRNRFKSPYSAWPLLHINVVSLNMSFHPYSFQAVNAHSPLSQSSVKGEPFSLLLGITRIAFHRQNYPRVSPSLLGNCYTEIVPGRWIYSLQVCTLSFILHFGSISKSIYIVFSAVFCIRVNVILVLLYEV